MFQGFHWDFFPKFNASACLKFPTVVEKRGSLCFKKVILYVFHTKFSVFLQSCPAHHPVLLVSVCSGTSSARCSVRLWSTVPRVNQFPSHRTSSTTIRYFPESLVWSSLQFRTRASAEDRQHFSLLAAAWIIHLQLLTLNQCFTTVLLSRSFAPLAIPPNSVPVRSTLKSSFVTITPVPSPWTLWTSCQYLFQNQSRLPVPFYPVCLHLTTQNFFSFFSISENKYAPAQITF